MNISSPVRYMLILATASLAAVLSEAASSPVHGMTGQELVSPSLRGLIVSDAPPRNQIPRIIGGQTSNDADRYPYFALMNGSAQCGAVLIAQRFVLTAAHCVGIDNDFEIGISEKLSFVEAWYTGTDSGGTEYPFKSGIVHPDYNARSVSSDIALYELEQDVPDSIPYIKLEKDKVKVSGTPLTVIGFGDTDPSATKSLSDVLLQTTVDFVPPGQCIARMGRYISNDMLCAYKEGDDSCYGDSGGPLFLKGATPADDSLVGLVSWGYECGGDYPGVYTNIAYFYDWIVESMCDMNPNAVPDYVDCSNVASGSGSGGNTFTPGGSGSGSGSGSGGSGGSGESTSTDWFQEIADWFNEAARWVRSLWS